MAKIKEYFLSQTERIVAVCLLNVLATLFMFILIADSYLGLKIINKSVGQIFITLMAALYYILIYLFVFHYVPKIKEFIQKNKKYVIPTFYIGLILLIGGLLFKFFGFQYTAGLIGSSLLVYLFNKVPQAIRFNKKGQGWLFIIILVVLIILFVWILFIILTH